MDAGQAAGPTIRIEDVDRFYTIYDAAGTSGRVAYSQIGATTKGREKEIETTFVAEPFARFWK